MPFSCCPFCDCLPDGLSALKIDQQDAVFRTVVSQKALQEHIAAELLNLFLLALPDRNDIYDEARDTDTERSLGSRSTVQHIEEDHHSSVSAEEFPQDQPDDADTGLKGILWNAVWATRVRRMMKR